MAASEPPEGGWPTYKVAEWSLIGVGRPLEAVGDEDMLTLQRAWVWTEHTRHWMDQGVIDAVHARAGAPLEWRETEMLEVETCAMYVAYALLWGVVERMTHLRIRFAGALRDDLRSVRGPLEAARNATFHVPQKYWDDRLFDLLGQSAQSISRVHYGLGRLIREEIDNRMASTS